MSAPPLPPLSFAALRDVRKIEQAARLLLRECNGIPFNVDRATEILRTCIVAAFDARVGYYLSLTSRHQTWIERVLQQTVASAVGMLPLEAQLRPAIKSELQQTLRDHIQNSDPLRDPDPLPAQPAAPLQKKPKTLGEQLDDLSILLNISHEDQAGEIGLSRATYFKVKAGGGGKKSRRMVDLYLSARSSKKTD